MKSKKELVEDAMDAIGKIDLDGRKKLSIREKYIRKDQRISIAKKLTRDYVPKTKQTKKEPK